MFICNVGSSLCPGRALNEQYGDLAPIMILGHHDITPAQVLRLAGAHPRVAHDQHKIIGNGSIPDARWLGGLGHPRPPDGMQLAVFLKRKFISPHSFEFGLALKPLAGGDIFLLRSVVHRRAKDRHFKADG